MLFVKSWYKQVAFGTSRKRSRTDEQTDSKSVLLASKRGCVDIGFASSSSSSSSSSSAPVFQVSVSAVSRPASLAWSGLRESQKMCWQQAGLIKAMVPEEGDEDIEIPLPNISEAMLPTIEGILSHKGWDGRLPNPLIENADGSGLSVTEVYARLNALHYLDAWEVPQVKAMLKAAQSLANRAVVQKVLFSRSHLVPFVTTLVPTFFQCTDAEFQRFVRAQECVALAHVPLEITINKDILTQYTRDSARIEVLRASKQHVQVRLVLAGKLTDLSVPHLGGVDCVTFQSVPDVPASLLSAVLAAGSPELHFVNSKISKVDKHASVEGVRKLTVSGEAAISPEFIAKILAAKISYLDLSGCNVARVTVPQSLAGIDFLKLSSSKTPSALISKALEANIATLDFSGCSFSGVTLPLSLGRVQSLSLFSVRDIAPVVSMALAARVPKIALINCNLSGVQVPDSLEGVQELILDYSKHIPELISKALAAKVPTISLFDCDLTGVVVPPSLKGIKDLMFSHKNTPPDLMFKALEAKVSCLSLDSRDVSDISFSDSLEGIESLSLIVYTHNPPLAFISNVLSSKIKTIRLACVDFSNLRVPDSLEGIQTLNLRDSKNIPSEFISKALVAGVKRLDMRRCNLSGVDVSVSLAGLQVLSLGSAEQISPDFISKALADTVPELDLSGCDLSGVVVPNSLLGMTCLYLSKAQNIPKGLREKALKAGVVLK